MRQQTACSVQRRHSVLTATAVGFAVVCAFIAIPTAWGINYENASLETAEYESEEASFSEAIITYPFANERQAIAAVAAANSSRSERIENAQAAESHEWESDSSEEDSEAMTYPITSLIQELLQYPELPAGCESVALTCVLNAMGYDVAATEIVENYLSIDPTYSDPNSFLGDPYTGGYAFPSAIIATANAYLADAGSSAHARDASGSTFDELLQTVEAGTPVLVWSTMYFAEPTFTGLSVGPYLTYYNEHCVVLYGFTEDVVYVSDPLEGLVERDRAEFQRLYEACGALAVVIE